MVDIDWTLVDYVNALRFLEIMKTWKAEVKWCSQADIERQERVVEECRAKLEQTSGRKPR
jgi:hypothetical protein